MNEMEELFLNFPNVPELQDPQFANPPQQTVWLPFLMFVSLNSNWYDSGILYAGRTTNPRKHKLTIIGGSNLQLVASGVYLCYGDVRLKEIAYLNRGTFSSLGELEIYPCFTQKQVKDAFLQAGVTVPANFNEAIFHIEVQFDMLMPNTIAKIMSGPISLGGRIKAAPRPPQPQLQVQAQAQVQAQQNQTNKAKRPRVENN